MADNNKDTIYVDIDDEITALIDKVKASPSRVVALVLPKRASVLQSIVNMKLLKRTAETEKKNLVLITTEAGLLPLAGAVGLHTAKTLTSKPEIPPGPNMSPSSTETVEEDMSLPLDDEDETPDLAKAAGAGATVGALADSLPKQPIGPTTGKDAGVETLQLDDEDKPETSDAKKTGKEAAAAGAAAAAASKVKKDKNPKVPNFDRFRVLLIVGVLAVIGLIILAILAFSVWPHATIDIKTDASNVNTNVTLTLDTQTQSADYQNGDIPAKLVSEQKTFTQTVNTTGQKNEGTAATGSVTMSVDDCPPYNYASNGYTFTIPAGTGISANNLTYITQQDATMSAGKPKSNGCIPYQSDATNISAQNPGTSYNAQITNGTVSGYPQVQANGSASGGTDNIVQIVSQTDVNTAASKINSSDASTVKQDLINELRGQSLYPVEVTFANGGSPQISSSPSVGDASNSVTVTETITYTMYGTKQSYLDQALDQNIHSQTAKGQNIISNGLSENAFRVTSSNSETATVALSTLAEVGPNISPSQIQKEAAGKSPQEIISQIKTNPDVTSVTVRLSPFWVSSAPSNQSKITVQVAKPSKSG